MVICYVDYTVPCPWVYAPGTQFCNLYSTDSHAFVYNVQFSDPLVSFLTDGVYRKDYEEALEDHIAPSIPTQPISYGDAIHFMRQLSVRKAPSDWQGQLNMTYYIMQDEKNTK